MPSPFLRSSLPFLSLTIAPLILSGQVIISEFDATNTGVLEDADGSESDWIELRNTGAVSVQLEGWALSDDLTQPDKWIFPAITLAAGDELVVFASGKDWRVSGVELHTGFKLSDGGEDLVLSQPDGAGGWTIEHAWTGYPPQKEGASYGLAGSTTTGGAGYFTTPTPGAPNGPAVITEFVADTAFNHHRGFYDEPFTLTITSPTPGATLIYTLDGSEPTAQHGTASPAVDATATPSATVAIDSTMIVRARAVKDGFGPTNIDTQSYIFPSDVLSQDASYVKASYAQWGHSGPDWAMDARVTGHANAEDRAVAEDLERIPTVSIALPWADLFGTAGPGIYIEGEGIDKRASFELLNPDGNDLDPHATAGQQGRGVVRVFGGSSTGKRWKTDKLSFRFNFWDDFDSDVLGEGAIGSYDRLILDARLNQVWNQSQNLEQRQFADYTRDAILTDLENKMGVHAVHSQHVHLYLNGLYWGLYTLHERPDNHFAEAYFGGDADDYDIVKHGPGEENFLVDGARIDPSRAIDVNNHTAGVNYLAMVNLALADLSVPSNYEALADKLDIPAFIVHMLSNFVGGNYDWPQHNWYASYNREDPDGKWRFHSWDAEHVFKYVDYPRYDNVTGKFEGWDRPDGINLQLLQNPEYRFQFADAAHRFIFNNGPLSAERIWAAFQRRFDDINEAIRAESARWGDNGPVPGELHLRYSNVPSDLASPAGHSDTTAFASWWHERERIRTKILGEAPNRITRFLEQMRNATYHEDHPLAGQPNPLYPETDAPVFSEPGGTVASGFSLTMMNPNAASAGTIYYTLDGSDPRQPFSSGEAFFSGSVNTTAAAYTGPPSIAETTTVKARVLRDGEWSALMEATYRVGTVEPASTANLVISEIHYHPTDPSLADLEAGFDDDGVFEFFEVLNIGTEVVSLDGLLVQQGLDIEALPDGVKQLAPGESALYVANPAAFVHRYGPSHPLAGQFVDSALSNSGERLHLLAADGSTITDLTYETDAPWPLAADGYGPSLVLIEPGTGDPAKASSWQASAAVGGSPGTQEAFSHSYGSWSEIHFSPSDAGYPEVADPGADPDKDGLSNLEEHFLGGDPWVYTPAGDRPQITLEKLDVGAGLQPYAVYTFRYQTSADDVTFAVETSTNLNSWNGDDLIVLGSPQLHEDGTETRRYRSAHPIDTNTVRFFILQLEQR